MGALPYIFHLRLGVCSCYLIVLYRPKTYSTMKSLIFGRGLENPPEGAQEPPKIPEARQAARAARL